MTVNLRAGGSHVLPGPGVCRIRALEHRLHRERLMVGLSGVAAPWQVRGQGQRRKEMLLLTVRAGEGLPSEVTLKLGLEMGRDEGEGVSWLYSHEQKGKDPAHFRSG